MIVESLITWSYDILYFLFNLLPSITGNIPANVSSNIASVFYGIAYFLPLVGLLPILIIDLSITSWRILRAVLLRVKSFVPLISGG